jgi:cholesterol transport system auxiliary component
VRRFDVDTAFAGKGLIYRIGEFQYESDYYHGFLIPPGIMIAEQTRDWLVNSGLFQRVLPVRSPLESTYLLEGNVTALYGDFTNKTAPQAVMEIRFFLVGPANAGERAMLAQTYRAVTPVPARTAEAFIGALSRGLAEILTRLEADLQKTLTERRAEPGPVVPSPGS